MKRLFGVLVLFVVVALALAACGSDAGPAGGGGSSTSDFNDADVTFAQSMIPHHEQAVVMAKMAKSHASAAEVKALAGSRQLRAPRSR